MLINLISMMENNSSSIVFNRVRFGYFVKFIIDLGARFGDFSTN
jgi:hypothetical protein